MSRDTCTEHDCAQPALITTGRCIEHTYLDEQARRPPPPLNVHPITGGKSSPMLPVKPRQEG